MFTCVMVLYKCWCCILFVKRVSLTKNPPLKMIDILMEFEWRYSKIHSNFAQEGFTDMVQRLRREFKLIFVYLHSWVHPEMEVFCKETLCPEVVAGFMNEHFVAWGESARCRGL
ncbi:Thioredoxin-like fold [Artemisia annua]|uniref:Thioredoxin-like fold n=1 Tax=Artemisia annua TaxID=35608 RepID=A0A2U1L8Q8_ARTAN|nr:Thioredoxin-like fold [Artemisia annua]